MEMEDGTISRLWINGRVRSPCAGSRMAGSSPPCPLEAQARSHPPLGTGSASSRNKYFLLRESQAGQVNAFLPTRNTWTGVNGGCIDAGQLHVCSTCIGRTVTAGFRSCVARVSKGRSPPCPQTNLQTPHSSLGPPQVHSHRCPHLPAPRGKSLVIEHLQNIYRN